MVNYTAVRRSVTFWVWTKLHYTAAQREKAGRGSEGILPGVTCEQDKYLYTLHTYTHLDKTNMGNSVLFSNVC